MNFKSKLLEWCQKNHLHAQYQLVDELRTKEGSPMFRSTVWIEGIECGTGQGFSKKESQQMASKSAIKKIEKDPALKEKLKETGLSKLNG